MIHIKNSRPFVIFAEGRKAEELGMSTGGYFAGAAWIESDERYNEIIGRSFGWMDSEGAIYCNDKGDMSRPSLEYIQENLPKHPELLKAAIKEGYVEIES
jgi:hypothetical protein